MVAYLFDHLTSLEDLVAVSPLGLITDIDGTISQIAPSPQEARVSPLCQRSLKELTRRLALVAAISGRPVLEALAMVRVRGMVYGIKSVWP